MSICRLGEFGLIERFRKSIRTDSSVVVGSGDDCAVLKFDSSNYQLFTCDMIVEGVDFLPKERPELIGRKAMAISISDIAACGGKPCHAVISLGLPKDLALKKVDQISRGLFKLAREYRINIVGGDISRSSKLTIDVSMLGLVLKKHLVLRSRARKGDIIFVSAGLGGSIRGKHLKFTPRLKESAFLVKNFKINSMIDISDGLAQDLGQVLKASRKGAVIYENLVPLSREARSFKEALFMGEDFELLFTMRAREAKRLMRQRHFEFFPIGEIVEAKYGLRLIDKQGREKILQSRGYRHF